MPRRARTFCPDCDRSADSCNCAELRATSTADLRAELARLHNLRAPNDADYARMDDVSNALSAR